MNKLMQIVLASLLLASLLLASCLTPVFGQSSEAKSENQDTVNFKPSETSVAVLFVPNNSSDKWKEQKVKESQAARNCVYKLFEERGFKPTPLATVDDAIAKADVDLKKEDNWTKANFYKIGKEAKADLVAFVLIKETRQKQVRNLLATQMVGEAEIEVWLVDAIHDTPIINDEPARGRSNGGIRDTSHRRNSAVEFAVKKGYESFTKRYPAVKEEKKK